MLPSSQPYAPGSSTTPKPAKEPACHSEYAAPAGSLSRAQRPMSSTSIGPIHSRAPAFCAVAAASSTSVAVKESSQRTGWFWSISGETAAEGLPSSEKIV